MGLFRKLREKLYQADVREVDENSKFLFERNRKGPVLIEDFAVSSGYLIGGLVAVAACLAKLGDCVFSISGLGELVMEIKRALRAK